MLGAEDKVLSGRSEQISVSEGVASTYACANCCPNTLESIEVDPFGTLSELGLDTPFTAFQTERSCNNTLFGPYEASPDSWASSDTAVATMFFNTAQAVGVGFTNIEACATRYLWYNAGGGQCQYITDQMCDAGTMEVVAPSVMITAIKAVGKNQTANVRVTTNNPGNVPITLTLSQTPQTTGAAQFTSTNSSTRQITATADVGVKGITESSTKRAMRLEAKYTNSSNQQVSLGMTDFTVVKATLSLKTSGMVSSDNQAKTQITTQIGTANLGGPALSTGAAAPLMRNKIEIKATILPSDWDELPILQRERVENRGFIDQTLTSRQVGCPDTSDLSLMDVDPQSGGSGGKTYDYDAPGIRTIGTDSNGTKRRQRVNFRQWLSIEQNHGAGTAHVRLTDDITWFNRISVIKYVSGATILLNDVTGDNTFGAGTTPLTWDLGSGTVPSASPC